MFKSSYKNTQLLPAREPVSYFIPHGLHWLCKGEVQASFCFLLLTHHGLRVINFKDGSLTSIFYGLKLQPAQLLALTAGLPAPSFPGHPSGDFWSFPLFPPSERSSPGVGPFQMLVSALFLCLGWRAQWDEAPLLSSLPYIYSQF